MQDSTLSGGLGDTPSWSPQNEALTHYLGIWICSLDGHDPGSMWAETPCKSGFQVLLFPSQQEREGRYDFSFLGWCSKTTGTRSSTWNQVDEHLGFSTSPGNLEIMPILYTDATWILQLWRVADVRLSSRSIPSSQMRSSTPETLLELSMRACSQIISVQWASTWYLILVFPILFLLITIKSVAGDPPPKITIDFRSMVLNLPSAGTF